MNDEVETNENAERAGDGEIGALEGLWRFLSSMKTAIVLLLLLAVASVAGTLIKQNQPAEVYTKDYGTQGYALIKSLGLNNVYHSKWYALLLGLVGANLTVCSIRRFGSAWRRTFPSDISARPEKIKAMGRSEKLNWNGDAEDAAGKVAGALRSRSYSVLKETKGDTISLHASRGRLGIWGPYLTHVSILVIFAGAIFGNIAGLEGYTKITEGKRTSAFYPRGSKEEQELGFSVGLRDFTIEHKNHYPIAYKSDLAVYNGDKVVAKKVVDVNHPLSYGGMSFYQVDYGLDGIVLKVTAPDGESVWLPFNVATRNVEQGKEYAVSDEPFKQVEVGGKKLTVFVHNLVPDYVGGEQINASYMPLNPAVDLVVNDRFPEYKGMDAWTKLGWVAASESADYKGLTITLDRAVDYTGLQVSRNPGLPVVYVGFALMVAGVFASFYVVRRTVRVNIASSKHGSTVLIGASARGDTDVFDKDFDRLREALS